MNYLIISDKADSLSQWRGYCVNGGVAVEFDIKRPRYYSILHTDNDTSKRYKLEYNVPYPVLYVSPEHLKPSSGMLSNYILNASNSNRYFPWKVRDIIPYLKDNAFCEESEWRLMFGNHDGLLSKCVRFRTLADGSKVPYMVVQFGNIGENYSRCDFNVNYFTDEVLKKMIEDGQYLINIPQGNDQESVYYKLEHIVNKFNESLASEQHIKIFCDGHLPVRKIITAPTYNRQRIAEKIKRFCWSKYWLRNLDISYSNIPYIPPSE